MDLTPFFYLKFREELVLIDEIISIGIDIGTTTTQIMLSRLVLENTAGSFELPSIKITDKQILYRSRIYFTPMDGDRVSAQGIRELVDYEIGVAGFSKEQISSGAVIITGESSSKENAKEVLQYISEYSGEFVVETAGPELEGVLAGYGAGAANASSLLHSTVVNFDIGGGTTNAALFKDGNPVSACAFHIGGRLVKIAGNGSVEYISPKIKHMASAAGIQLGALADFAAVKTLTDRMAQMILKLIDGRELDFDERELVLGKGNQTSAERFMFSGGVAEYIYDNQGICDIGQTALYGDIGPMLGASIRECIIGKANLLTPSEKINATVIGAGAYSVEISGSTITYEESMLPLKNIPVIKLSDKELDSISDKITEKMAFYRDTDRVAICFKGSPCPSYNEIKKLAAAIGACFPKYNQTVIVIVENDFAKALGQTLRIILKRTENILCIDRIKVNNGDYIDIGKPIAGVIPVVVKTLIFNK